MKKNYATSFAPARLSILHLYLVVGLSGSVCSVNAQQLALTGFTPAPNARAVAVTSSVTATFNQLLTPSSTAALQIYSARRGGRRTGADAALLQAASLVYKPTLPFVPGETVLATLTQAASSTTGGLDKARVHQFTVATGGTGRGQFSGGSDPAASAYPFALAVGDVDGDGDLDLLTADQGDNTVRVELNGGDASGSQTGTFLLGSTATVGGNPYSMALGDVDGDGDLDLVVANYGGTSSVSVRLNGGDATGSHSGRFSHGSEVTGLSNAYGVALTDVDGDGDLDLLVTENNADGKITIRLNGGDNTGSMTGVFSQGSSVRIDPGPFCVVAGDVDNDGDQDLLTTHYSTGRVRVLLNGGDATGSQTGVYSQGSTLLLSGSPYGLALGDVDGDGDLDLAVTNMAENRISIRLNGGDNTGSASGEFSRGMDVVVGQGPMQVALGDIDADGDLDIVTANAQEKSGSVRLNGGDASGSNTGVFSGGSTVGLAERALQVALADVDGDQDLDLLLATRGVVSVRLNQPVRPLAIEGAVTHPEKALVVAPTILEQGQLHYTYVGQGLTGQSVLEVYSLNGQLLWQQDRNVAPRGTLPLANLLPGYYLLRLTTPTGVYHTRFVQP